MLLEKDISITFFIKQIKTDILAISFYAILIGILDQYSFLAGLTVPLALTATIGTAVSLLLGFRTAQSYERWWEARTIWGAIVNESRTLIRQLMQHLPESATKQNILNAFAERQAIWCLSLGESLRRLNFSPRVKKYLEAEQITESNVPNALITRHSLALAESDMSEFRQVQVVDTLTRLCDAMGKCERIKSTIFPKSYSMLVHLLIYVFATFLPFGLDDKHVLVEIALTIIIPLIFISIERTAIFMQDPFENEPMDTPMTALATTIEINLKQMIGRTDVPRPHEPEEYYLM